MADVIYKYGPIEPKMDWITCKGDPLHVGIHADGNIYVWCRLLCEIEEPERKVKLVATGEPYIGPYVGTVITRNGLVWHLIEYMDDSYGK
jgi:hypothetical protein